MAGEWQDGVSIHCYLSLAFDGDIMQGYESGGGEKEERSLGVVRNRDRAGFSFSLHTSFPFVPNG